MTERASLSWLRLTHRFASVLVKLGLWGIASLLLALIFYAIYVLKPGWGSSLSFLFLSIGMALLGFSAIVAPFLLASWFLISLFCYGRYSLISLLGIVLLIGACMALIFSENDALGCLGILLLVLLFAGTVSYVILKFDPLFHPQPNPTDTATKNNSS